MHIRLILATIQYPSTEFISLYTAYSVLRVSYSAVVAVSVWALLQEVLCLSTLHTVYNLTWIPAHMRQTMQLYHLQTNSDLFCSSAGLLGNCSRWEYWLV